MTSIGGAVEDEGGWEEEEVESCEGGGLNANHRQLSIVVYKEKNSRVCVGHELPARSVI